MVERMTGESAHARQTGQVEHHSPVVSPRPTLPHMLHRLHRHAHRAEEVRLQLLVHLVFGCGLRVAGEGIARIVHHDVEVEVLAAAAEVGGGCGETGVDRAGLRDI